MRESIKKQLRRELMYWGYYLAASFISTSVAYDAFERSERRAEALGEPLDLDINVRGMVAVAWQRYYRWWFYAFLVLSIIRFGVVLIIITRRGRVKGDSGRIEVEN